MYIKGRRPVHNLIHKYHLMKVEVIAKVEIKLNLQSPVNEARV